MAQTWNDNPKIYKYSVIPGGIWSQAEAKEADLGDVSIAQLRRPLNRHVSYVKDGMLYWTSQELMIAAHEFVWVHTGGIMVRARCGNVLAPIEMYPEEQLGVAPKPEEFDETLEIPEIEIPMQPFFDNSVDVPETQIAKRGLAPSSNGVPVVVGGAFPFIVPFAVGGYAVPVAAAVPAPEPGVFGLVAAGLIGVGMFWRFKK